MPQNHKKALAYVRSATAVEEDQILLDLQTTDVINFANQAGYVITPSDVLQEVASGVSLDRPQLNRVRLMVATGQVGALFAYSPDRLSRDPVDLSVLMGEFASHGVEVHFVQGPLAAAPKAESIDAVVRLAADLERSDQRERTVRGMDAVARSGRMPTGSHSHPFGYRFDADAMKRVFDEAEAPVVKRVFDLYAEGLEVGEIVEKCNAEGVKMRTGKPWTHADIRKILTTTSYVGLDYYGKTSSVGGGKRVAKPKEEWIEIRGYTPALVSEALFEKVQERLAGPR